MGISVSGYILPDPDRGLMYLVVPSSMAALVSEKLREKNKYGRYSLEWAVDMISSGKMNLQKIMEGNILMPLLYP